MENLSWSLDSNQKIPGQIFSLNFHLYKTESPQSFSDMDFQNEDEWMIKSIEHQRRKFFRKNLFSNYIHTEISNPSRDPPRHSRASKQRDTSKRKHNWTNCALWSCKIFQSECKFFLFRGVGVKQCKMSLSKLDIEERAKVDKKVRET